MPDNSWGTVDPGSVPLSRPAEQIIVLRVPTDPFSPKFDTDNVELLLNVFCTAITVREGAHPPTASFRYSFDPNFLPSGLPLRFHQVYGNVTPTQGVVRIDDRLLVVRILGGADANGDGSLDNLDFMYLFDGYVTNPQANADGSSERVTIEAVATPVREWDMVLPGAIWGGERSKDGPDKTLFKTEVPARFNPNGKHNACDLSQQWTGKYYFNDPDNDLFYSFVSVHSDDKWKFYDKDIDDYLDVPITQWTLGMAARYIVGVGIEWPLGMGGTVLREEPFVSVYDMPTWDKLFQSIVPSQDGGVVDLSDPSTFTRRDIACPDVEVTGEAWPNALEKLIKPFGFLFRFDLRTNQDGTPEWLLTCYRADDARLQTQMSLQDPSDIVYDPAKTNVGALNIQRDAVHVANEFEVDTQLVAYEATFILAPAFKIQASDAVDNATGLEKWKYPIKDPALAHYYRKFVFAEGNSLYFEQNAPDLLDNFEMTQNHNKSDELAKLFDVILTSQQAKVRPPYSRRNRATFGRLNTPTADGKEQMARLHISTIALPADPGIGPKYKGKMLKLWDGTGTWQEVTSTEWKRLDDEIGIMITANDPNNWGIGEPKEGAPTIDDNGGRINLVERLAAPTATTMRIVLAFTTVIFGDKDLDATATIRKSSISRFRIRRRIDARDRWKRKITTWYSMPALQKYDLSEFGEFGYIDIRNDTDDAKDAAVQMQRVHEMGSHSGTITIRRISTAYNVGQTITKILGRNVDLKLNAGAPKSETPLYPRVATITFNLDNEQSTTLTLTDERAQPITRRVSLQLAMSNQQRQAKFGT